MTEDEMFGWHQLDGHEFEQALGVGDGQGSLACYDSWGCKELDMTERLSNNNNDLKEVRRCSCGSLGRTSGAGVRESTRFGASPEHEGEILAPL